MKTIHVNASKSYDILIERGVLERAGEEIKTVCGAGEALIVSDDTVWDLYGETVLASMQKAGFDVTSFTFPHGEQSKNLSVYADILNALAARHLSRKGLVVALGGGVVGDMAGFAAATYLRGVRFVQIPTTLLSQVDSSVGGKTGVNLSAGKNLVGTFTQPAYVCASTKVLSTLPSREWACGCGEIAKSSVIDSDEFFFWLSDNASALASRDHDVIAEAIARSVVVKAAVVAQDKKESRVVRECLNYGHTLGHAVESLAGYGTYSHGAAVAEGMRFAARLGAAIAGTSIDVVRAQDNLLDELGLPALSWSAAPEDMLAVMKRDKKVRGGVVKFVLPLDIGQWELREVEDDVILEHLAAWARSK